MESRGLICRKKSDDDSRGAVVELNDEGARVFRASSAPHLRLIPQLFIEALTPEDLEEHRIVGKLRQHLKEEPGLTAPSRWLAHLNRRGRTCA